MLQQLKALIFGGCMLSAALRYLNSCVSSLEPLFQPGPDRIGVSEHRHASNLGGQATWSPDHVCIKPATILDVRKTPSLQFLNLQSPEPAFLQLFHRFQLATLSIQVLDHGG